MANGNTLLPCPFCGTPPKGPTRMSGRLGPDWLIQCPACMVKIECFAEPGEAGDPVPGQMVEAWNRRADITLPPTAEVKASRSADFPASQT